MGGSKKILLENPEIVTFGYSADKAVQQKNLRLLDSYYDAYQKIFTIPEEVVPKDVYVKALTDPEFYPRIVITLQGNQLTNPKEAKVAAFLHGEYYEKSDSSFIAYIAADRENYAFRDSKTKEVMRVSSKAVREANDDAILSLAQERSKGIKAKFAAINSPIIVKESEDVMNPWKRAEIMHSWGADIVPIDFVQPALSETTAPCEILSLINYPTPGMGSKSPPEQTLAFLQDFMESLGIKNVQADHDYQRMKAQLTELAEGAALPSTLSRNMHRFVEACSEIKPPVCLKESKNIEAAIVNIGKMIGKALR